MTEREVDLFGQEIPYQHPSNGNRGRNANPRGYAARPGTGPADETCQSCEHYCILRGKYRKCELLKWRWTHGAGTDIRARSPACRYWQAAV